MRILSIPHQKYRLGMSENEVFAAAIENSYDQTIAHIRRLLQFPNFEFFIQPQAVRGFSEILIDKRYWIKEIDYYDDQMVCSPDLVQISHYLDTLTSENIVLREAKLLLKNMDSSCKNYYELEGEPKMKAVSEEQFNLNRTSVIEVLNKKLSDAELNVSAEFSERQQPIIDGLSKNIAVLRSSKEELLTRNKEREMRIREFTIKLQTPNGLNELESEPAYLRRKIHLEDPQHSSESNLSRFTLNETTDENGESKVELRENPFLHDNVD